MKIRKTLVVMTLTLAMCVTGITMTGCGDTASDGTIKASEITLKEALEANPDAVWFLMEEKDFSKDNSPGEAFQFKDGMVTIYPLLGLTLGEISKTDPKDLPEVLRESCRNELMKHCQDQLELKQGYLESSKEEYQKKEYDPREEFIYLDDIEEYTQAVEGLNAYLSSLEPMDSFVTTTPYVLSIVTDGSGNNTKEERVNYYSTRTTSWSKWLSEIEKGLETEQTRYYFPLTYGSYIGPIYDSEYGGFYARRPDGATGVFFTKTSPETTFLLDEPGAEDILVDPSKKEIKQLLHSLEEQPEE